jgi:cathepsin A (carboxypeptidase C)
MTGIAVGNGLTHPEEQYKWYAEMGGDGGVSQGGHAPAVFNKAVVAAMNAAMPSCVKSIHQCNSGTANATAPWQHPKDAI